MNHQPIQREFTLDHALVLANASLKKLNVDFTLQKMGTAGQLHTYLCLMNSHTLKIAFRGAGSGLEQEAKVKAIYEAIEDSLLYQTLSYLNENLISMFSTQSSPSTHFLQQNELLPAVLNEEAFLKNPYPWLKLEKLHSSSEVIYYPLSLVFPHASHIDDFNKYVDQHPISQMANSTGLAMGATAAEALIHGINDWIERDAYGLFLLSTIIKNNKPARCLLKPTLPDNIQKNIAVIENTYNDELMVIDITSNFTIPAFFVSFTKQNVPVQPSGLGASLCREDALQQALLEALQARDRFNSNTISARRKTLRYYKKYPLLLKAFQCDLNKLRDAGCINNISWNEIISHQVNKDLNNQIGLMLTILASFGVDIYHTILFQESNGLTLTYVLLSGVETFGMMREGIFVPIKKRGLKT